MDLGELEAYCFESIKLTMSLMSRVGKHRIPILAPTGAQGVSVTMFVCVSVMLYSRGL